MTIPKCSQGEAAMTTTNENYDIFKGHGIEVKIAHPDDFLKIMETLTRIGIASRKEKKLYQSCHILHKRGRYAILHFKELFAMDGKGSEMEEGDIRRRDVIVSLLEKWGLLKTVTKLDEKSLETNINIKVIPHSQKDKWILESKYSIGKK